MAGAPVYGVELSSLCESQGFLIPPFLTQLMKYIEENGIDREGIYRISDLKIDILKLRDAIETGSGQEIELEGVNVHCATACLKWFFKDLPTPLIPCDMFLTFIEAAKSPIEDSVEKFTGLMKQLPHVNYYILREIIQHLRRIANHSEANKMPRRNLGVVFGSSLLRPEQSSRLSGQLLWQGIVVQTLIDQCDDIFPQHEPVFGCVLQELFERYSGVPPFLINFMNFIEKNGLKRPELYKGSGISTKKDQLYMDMLRMKIETRDHDLRKHDWATVPIVGGCIKEFFKELPEPLIPYDMHHSFIVAAKSLHTRRARHLAILVKELPEANFMTLVTFIHHLTKACDMSHLNELTPENVGHIFGMVVMRPEEEMTLEVAMQNVRYQNRIVEVMVSNFETVFDIAPVKRRTRDGRMKKKQNVRKDPAFGIDLTTKCENDDEEVPRFFTQSVEYLEKKALDIVGLYKIAANPAAVQLFQRFIETGKDIVFEDLNWIDVHIVADTLKQYLKELPESLIPSDLHDSFIKVAKIKRLPQKLEQYESLLMEMPDAHYRVLRYFLRHIKKIVLNKRANKSSAAKMGILFGSVIMRSPERSSDKKVLGLQNSVVEVLVRNYGKVFRRSFPVFGTDLAMLCKHERETVPLFLTQIIEQLESKGLIQEVSIYRINGCQTDMQRIMEQIDEGEELDLDAPELLQGHNLTGMVKNYLLQLPEPLIPPDITSELLTASTGMIEGIRAEKFASILRKMPEYNYCTLTLLLDDLMKVISCSRINKMTPSNLCIIFTPLLMRPDFVEALTMSHSNAVKILIESWPIISDVCHKYRYAPVFGGELSAVCAREERTVPAFFEQFINYIERSGLENEDFYRTMQSNSAHSCINNLKKRVDQGLNLDRKEVWMIQQVVANCLKLYLKELPDPLIPHSLYDSFIAVIKNYKEHVDRVEKLSLRVKELDFAHYHTLKFFMGHLKKVADISEVNEMTPHVLGVIFGQIVIRPGPEKVQELNIDLVQTQEAVIRTMIEEYDSVFP